ncbi:hypothetical protein JL721_11153 [Aureococcus anophagefferens]|nr:hypothetical protein JL721_11153 [Aureococcus anophagefferens]
MVKTGAGAATTGAAAAAARIVFPAPYAVNVGGDALVDVLVEGPDPAPAELWVDGVRACPAPGACDSDVCPDGRAGEVVVLRVAPPRPALNIGQWHLDPGSFGDSADWRRLAAKADNLRYFTTLRLNGALGCASLAPALAQILVDAAFFDAESLGPDGDWVTAAVLGSLSCAAATRVVVFGDACPAGVLRWANVLPRVDGRGRSRVADGDAAGGCGGWTWGPRRPATLTVVAPRRALEDVIAEDGGPLARILGMPAARVAQRPRGPRRRRCCIAADGPTVGLAVGSACCAAAARLFGPDEPLLLGLLPDFTFLGALSSYPESLHFQMDLERPASALAALGAAGFEGLGGRSRDAAFAKVSDSDEAAVRPRTAAHPLKRPPPHLSLTSRARLRPRHRGPRGPRATPSFTGRRLADLAALAASDPPVVNGRVVVRRRAGVAGDDKTAGGWDSFRDLLFYLNATVAYVVYRNGAACVAGRCGDPDLLVDDLHAAVVAVAAGVGEEPSSWPGAGATRFEWSEHHYGTVIAGRRGWVEIRQWDADEGFGDSAPKRWRGDILKRRRPDTPARRCVRAAARRGAYGAAAVALAADLRVGALAAYHAAFLAAHGYLEPGADAALAALANRTDAVPIFHKPGALAAPFDSSLHPELISVPPTFNLPGF